VEELSEENVEMVDLGLHSGYDIRPWRLRHATRMLRDWDLLHMHAFNVPLALAVARSGKPVVFSDHGSRPARESTVARSKRHLLARFLRDRADAVAANSRRTAVRTQELYGVDSKAIAVIHNGIERDGAPPPRPRRGDGVTAAFVGRLVEFKRIDRLIDAVALVPDHHELRVRIVGEGPLGAALRERTDRAGVAHRVEFLGARADVPAVLADVDVLVHPSQDEPFGLAVLEAVALGLLPVVFADAGGALEVLPPGGRVVDDVADLARTLIELRASDDFSPSARARRADWARETFSVEKTAAGYEALYLEVSAK
jgi:glycosyltransferase involved in cell wall biosynthesis